MNKRTLTKARHIKNSLFRFLCGFFAFIFFSLFLILFAGIYQKSKNVFWQYHLNLKIPEKVKTYKGYLHHLPRDQKVEFISSMLGDRHAPPLGDDPGADYLALLTDQDLFHLSVLLKKSKGSLESIRIPVSKLTRRTLYEKARHSESYPLFIQKLQERGIITSHWNWKFFFHHDSHDARYAGLWGAFMGTLLTLGVIFVTVIPMGVGAAIYLEEFAPRNRLFAFFDVNLNNLASIPSVIFGIIGLAIFINFLAIPRSSSLVAGLTLSLMALPQVIVSTREALKAVPNLIREGALGLGASPMQIVLHHVLPVAFAPIVTGVLMALTRALGESAPLLMIGLVVFVLQTPQNLTDPVTVLPIQIFNWARHPEYGFIEKAAAGILFLLGLLFLLSTLAIWVREKYRK